MLQLCSTPADLANPDIGVRLFSDCYNLLDHDSCLNILKLVIIICVMYSGLSLVLNKDGL